MSKLGFGMWCEWGTPSCFVAPKSNYTKEEFEEECEDQAEGYYELEKTKENYARWYPVAPEGIDVDGGTYAFCEPKRGSFPVWVKDIKLKEETQ